MKTKHFLLGAVAALGLAFSAVPAQAGDHHHHHHHWHHHHDYGYYYGSRPYAWGGYGYYRPQPYVVARPVVVINP